MTTEEKIEVMKAYAEGKKIQVRDKTLKVWIDWGTCGEPEWDWGINDYRIKPEDKYRPYKDTDEMISDWKERFVAKDWPSHSMPLIWLMCGETRSFVTDYLPDSVYAFSTSLTMQDIYEDYTYLDGSPCGMKED